MNTTTIITASHEVATGVPVNPQTLKELTSIFHAADLCLMVPSTHNHEHAALCHHCTQAAAIVLAKYDILLRDAAADRAMMAEIDQISDSLRRAVDEASGGEL